MDRITKVYDQFDRAFANVSAKAVLWNGKHVANVTLKHGRSVVAYVHWIGTEMQRGTAVGGGYDRASAAVFSAIDKLRDSSRGEYEGAFVRRGLDFPAFVNAHDRDSGVNWDRHLRDAGFTIINVIG